MQKTGETIDVVPSQDIHPIVEAALRSEIAEITEEMLRLRRLPPGAVGRIVDELTPLAYPGGSGAAMLRAVRLGAIGVHVSTGSNFGSRA